MKGFGLPATGFLRFTLRSQGSTANVRVDRGSGTANMITTTRIRSVCWPALLVALWALQGCGPYLGPGIYQDLDKHGGTTYGASAGFRTYPAESRGLVAGIGGALSGSSCCSQWRVNGDIGYGRLPLAHESRVGIEWVAQPGAGRRDVDRGPTSTAIGMGWQVAVPIRISPDRLPWQVNPKLEPIQMLVPSVTLTSHRQLGKEALEWHNELSFSVTYRFHLWPVVKP